MTFHPIGYARFRVVIPFDYALPSRRARCWRWLPPLRTSGVRMGCAGSAARRIDRRNGRPLTVLQDADAGSPDNRRCGRSSSGRPRDSSISRGRSTGPGRSSARSAESRCPLPRSVSVFCVDQAFFPALFALLEPTLARAGPAVLVLASARGLRRSSSVGRVGGFPWVLLGDSQAAGRSARQLLGVYGVSASWRHNDHREMLTTGRRRVALSRRPLVLGATAQWGTLRSPTDR